MITEKRPKKMFRVFARVDEETKQKIASLIKPEDEGKESPAVRRVIEAGMSALFVNKVDTK